MRRVASGMQWLAAALVMLAGLSKAWDVRAFAEALSTWSLLPQSLIPSLAIAVPTVEVLLAGLVLFRMQERTAAIGLIIMLCVFTGGLAVQAAFGESPDCGCFGKIMAFEQAQSDARWAVLRNAALIGAVASPFLLRLFVRSSESGAFKGT